MAAVLSCLPTNSMNATDPTFSEFVGHSCHVSNRLELIGCYMISHLGWQPPEVEALKQKAQGLTRGQEGQHEVQHLRRPQVWVVIHVVDELPLAGCKALQQLSLRRFRGLCHHLAPAPTAWS